MKKYLLFALFLCSSFAHLFAQFDFGIKLELNQSDPSSELSDWSSNNLDTELDNLFTQDNVGFGLGVLASYKLSDRWAITTQPGIVFNGATVTYLFDNGDEHIANLDAVQIQIPVQLECHFPKFPLRPYLLGGALYAYDLTDDADDRLIDLSQQSASVFAGLGLEFRFKQFAFHPELIIQKSVNNQLEEVNTIYNTALDDLKIDYIALRFNFSGV